MKRDLDLIRDLLLEIEAAAPGRHSGKKFRRDERSDEEIAWHLALLADANFIIASPDGKAFSWEPMRRLHLGQMMIYRLLEGSPHVLSLFESNPFPDKPPKVIRVNFATYHFTTWQQRKETGRWWNVEDHGVLTTLSLK